MEGIAHSAYPQARLIYAIELLEANKYTSRSLENLGDLEQRQDHGQRTAYLMQLSMGSPKKDLVMLASPLSLIMYYDIKTAALHFTPCCSNPLRLLILMIMISSA
ncbi:unnamed protein product [Dibothriocephalus latus]|uniref:Uncharacterized protein n=1 Tax=Dibothriocephalus latus TaxID=60516 RepID=A0A3P7N0R0_DIBLA|nr:unnamed protein product [Dibothriocephalus latus]